MSGCIAVTAAETGRYSMFSAALGRLERPPGTKLYLAAGSDREQGRNVLVRAMLDDGHDWLLFLDDDQVFGDDLLMRLLAHDLDVVGGVYLRRDRPFTPVAYPRRASNGRWEPLLLAGTGLARVRAVGTGGMLVRRQVFEALNDPWFMRGEETEDLIFCERLAGKFDVWVDLDAPLGHMTVATVWPMLKDGRWMVGFDVAGEITFLAEQAQ